MTRSLAVACLAIALAAVSGAKEQSPAYGALPLSFAANRGQAPQGVRFIARGPGYRVLLFSNSAEIVAGGSAVRMTLMGAARSPRIEAAERLWPIHYLIGREPSRWHTNIPTYGRVLYHSVYPGIDLVFYGNERHLEYDFTVRPGADPRAIRFEIGGAARMRVDPGGDLSFETGAGVQRFRKPFAYQMLAGARRQVRCGFQVDGRRVTFRTGEYDRTRPLVIDPVFVYSTYLGGSGSNDSARTMAVDRQGNAYIAGTTDSADFPATAGALQPRLTPGDCAVTSPRVCPDIFVAKLNAAGTALVYATYLGGTYSDTPYRVAVNEQGSVHILGTTNSYDFPIVNQLFEPPAQPGVTSQYFLAKLSADGSRLLYSTRLPDVKSYLNDLALDPEGNVWLTGSAGADWPRVNALQEYTPPATIFKTTDNGGTWQAAGAIPGPAPDIAAFAVDPKSPLNLYAVTSAWRRLDPTRAIVYRSTDGGRTWKPSAADLPGVSIFAGEPLAIALDPASPSTIYLGTGSGVFKSTDSGETWVRAGQPMPVRSLAIDPRTPSTLYAGTFGAGFVQWSGPVYKSTDSGATWTPTGVSAAIVAVDPRTPAIVYAASLNNVYKSTDAGLTWKLSNSGITSNAVIRALAIDPVNPNILYAAGQGRPNLVHKSTDGGATWQPAVGGLLLGEVTALVLNPLAPSQLFTAATDGISVSNDGAATWAPVARQLPGQGLPTLSPLLAIDPFTGALYAPLPRTLPYYGDLPSEAFVMKIAASGSAVLFSTPLGGSFRDAGHAIAVDQMSRVHVAGFTSSPDFPIVNPLQPNKVGQNAGFLTVLANDGSAVLSSTYLDGPAAALGVDAHGNSYVSTSPPSFTGSGDFRSVISRVDPFTPALLYSVSSFAGNASLAVNRGGDVYVAETSFGGLQPCMSNAAAKTRITKLDFTGAPVFSTCFGGSGTDTLYALAADDSGGLYLAGTTSSPDFPTINALQPALNGQVDAFVTKMDTNAQVPAPELRSVVSAANYRPEAIAPGSLVSLFGAGLASGVEGASAIPLPSALIDTRVSFNGVPAPLLYVSPDQINAQVPFEVAPGPVTVSITRGGQSASRVTAIAEAGPGIFALNGQGTGPGAILHAGDLTAVSDASPARPGEALAIYCTGLGRLRSSVPSGGAPTLPPPETMFRPEVRVAGRSATVTFSGAAPLLVGLYQVNIEMPPDTPAGLQPVVLSINGVESNTVQLAVR